MFGAVSKVIADYEAQSRLARAVEETVGVALFYYGLDTISQLHPAAPVAIIAVGAVRVAMVAVKKFLPSPADA